MSVTASRRERAAGPGPLDYSLIVMYSVTKHQLW